VTAGVALAVLAALVYGAADFLGGLAARRAAAFAVAAISQLVGLVALAAVAAAFPSHCTRAEILWGAVAGLCGGAAVVLLYRALAVGTMSVVAPVTAVMSLALPVGVGLLLGDHPGWPALFGVALAVAAVVLIGSGPSDPLPGAAPVEERPAGPWHQHPSAALVLALASGALIGLFYVGLSRSGPQAGMWPLVAARAASVVAFALVAAASAPRRAALRVPSGAWTLLLAAGLLDVLANALYLVAVRQGLLSIVAALASLYPASTVVLARIVLAERLRPRQSVGLAVATVAAVLMAAFQKT